VLTGKTMSETLIASFGERALCQTILAAGGCIAAITDRERRIRYWGDDIADALGYDAKYALGRHVSDFFVPGGSYPDPYCLPVPTAENRERTVQLLGFGATPVNLTYLIYPILGDDGTPVGMLYRIKQATRRSRRSRAITEPVSEKHGAFDDAFDNHALEELNHQVRNTLAIICALLEMEMLQTPDAERRRLRVSLARIRSLALLYNLLSQDDENRVEVGTLTRAVLDSVTSLFGRHVGQITIDCTGGTLPICLRRGTYLGLVITEVAVHMLGQALSPNTGTSPTVSITEAEHDVIITLRNTVASEVEPALDALSREILVGLVERSLGGAVRISEGPTFEVVIRCPLDAPVTSRCE